MKKSGTRHLISLRLVGTFLFMAVLPGVFLGITSSQQIGVDVDLSVDKTNWIDPADPLHKPFKSRTPPVADDEQCFSEEHMVHYIEENRQLREHIKAVEEAKTNSIDPVLKLILRNLLQRLNVDPESGKAVYRDAKVILTEQTLFQNMRIIHRYLASEKSAEEFGLREDLRHALESFLIEVDNGSRASLFSTLHRLVPYIIIANILLLPLAFIVVCRSIFTIRQFFIALVIAAFCMSYYFTYSRKYQEVLAQRMERVETKSRSLCTPKGLISEAYDALLSYVRIKGKSDCLQSHEDILIEPILLVDPLQVLGEVVSNFFLSPLTVAGSSFNKFFNDFFIGTPIPLAILKGIFLVIVMFYLSGYRIRTLIATIEPAVGRYFPYQAVFDMHHPQHLPVPPPPHGRIMGSGPEITEVPDAVQPMMLPYGGMEGDTSSVGSDYDKGDGSSLTSSKSQAADDSKVTRRRKRPKKTTLLSEGSNVEMEVYE